MRDVKDDGGGGGAGRRGEDTDTQIVDCLANFLPCDREQSKLALMLFSFPLTSAPFSQLHALWSRACVFSQVLLTLLIHLTSYDVQNHSYPKTYGWTLALYISDPTRRLHESSNTHIGMHVRGCDMTFFFSYIQYIPVVYNSIFPFLRAVTLPNFLKVRVLDFYCGIK